MLIITIINLNVLKKVWHKRRDLIKFYAEGKPVISQAQQGKLLRILKILILTVLACLLVVK